MKNFKNYQLNAKIHFQDPDAVYASLPRKCLKNLTCSLTQLHEARGNSSLTSKRCCMLLKKPEPSKHGFWSYEAPLISPYLQVIITSVFPKLRLGHWTTRLPPPQLPRLTFPTG